MEINPVWPRVHQAAALGDIEEFQKLLSDASKLIMPDKWSALHIACMFGQADIVLFMLETLHDMDPTIGDCMGYCPLTFALKSGNELCIQHIKEWQKTWRQSHQSCPSRLATIIDDYGYIESKNRF